MLLRWHSGERTVVHEFCVALLPLSDIPAGQGSGSRARAGLQRRPHISTLLQASSSLPGLQVTSGLQPLQHYRQYLPVSADSSAPFQDLLRVAVGACGMQTDVELRDSSSRQ